MRIVIEYHSDSNRARSASQVPKCTWEKGEAWLREERRISSVTVSGFFLGLIVQFKRIIDQTLSSLLSQACCKAKAPLLVEAERKIGKQSVFSVSQCCKSYVMV